jgi:hypothetical protein
MLGREAAGIARRTASPRRPRGEGRRRGGRLDSSTTKRLELTPRLGLGQRRPPLCSIWKPVAEDIAGIDRDLEKTGGGC